MTRRLALLAVVLFAAVLSYAAARPRVIEVTPGGAMRAIGTAPAGTTIRLLPGAHGPFHVGRAVTIQGAHGAEVRGPITIMADGVRLEDLQVVGGEAGVTIMGADDVILDRVTVRGARLHGIEVVDGSATIRRCRIAGLLSPFAQGFEIRNSSARPRTVVEGCSVSSGQKGLLSHVSRVEFRDNRVTGTTLSAITVTEMSQGLVEGNVVDGGMGVGLYCGDMSHCEVRGNAVRNIAPDASGARSRAGLGAVASYHSSMRLRGNTFDVAAEEPVGLFTGSTLTERSPLSNWPPGWAGAIPGLWVSAASLLGLGLVRLALAPWLRRRRTRGAGRTASQLALHVLTAGFVIQTFHMLEHVVQVFQVYVAEAEVRSGLAGATLDNEWVHFVYNAAVMAFLIWAWRLVRPGGPLAERVGSGVAFLGAAALIQAYHLAEHTAKMVQHLGSGLDPAPGLLGATAGLVWFHYGINLAVYVGMAIPLIGVAYRGIVDRLSVAGVGAPSLRRAVSPNSR